MFRNAYMKFNDAVFNLNNSGFNCGHKAINKDFHALLQTDKYPVIALELLEVTMADAAIAKIKISIAGKHKLYTLPIEVHSDPITCFTGYL